MAALYPMRRGERARATAPRGAPVCLNGLSPRACGMTALKGWSETCFVTAIAAPVAAGKEVRPVAVDADLARAYGATTYQLTVAGRQLSVRVGSPAPQLAPALAELGAARWAFVTAWNPRSERLAVADNARRNAQLFQRLGECPHAPAIAIPDDEIWPREPGFAVFDMALPRLLSLAQAFGQHAIVVGEGGGAPELVWVGEAASE